MTRQTVGYIRVSTDKQKEEGLSLEAQTAKLRAMAVVRDEPLADIIVDAASAKSLQRPGLTRLLKLVDAGQVQTVIIVKLDRLTRSVGDLGPLLTRLDRRHVALVSVTETLDTQSAHGRLILYILVSVSQWEREAIGERTREVAQHIRAKGERVGTIPFGFQLKPDESGRRSKSGRPVQLEPNTVEQTILAHIRAHTAAGESTRAIAATLNELGYTTRRGGPVRFQYVARLAARNGNGAVHL